jgi:hypothetical protein
MQIETLSQEKKAGYIHSHRERKEDGRKNPDKNSNPHQDISSENYAAKRNTFHKDISQRLETKKSRTQIS